jgi:hypothetical protein
MSKVLTNYVRPSFADDVIAALGSPKRGIAYSDKMVHKAVSGKTPSSAFAGARAAIRQARRFEVENNIVDLAWQRSLKGWDTLVPDIERAIPPFDTMWIEWDEKYRQELVSTSYGDHPVNSAVDSTEQVGYQITKLNMTELAYYFQPYFRDLESNKVIANPIGFVITPDSTLGSTHFLTQDREFMRAYHLVLQNILIFRYPEAGALEQFSFKHKLSMEIIDAAVDAINGKIMMYGGALQSTLANHPWDHGRLLIAEDARAESEHKNLWLYHADSDLDNALRAWNRSSVVRTDFMHLITGSQRTYKDIENDVDHIKSIAGDIRFVVSLIAMLNYNWIAPMGTPMRSSIKSIAYGKRKPNSVYYRLGITLPKDQIQMRLHDPKHSSPQREHEVRGHWRKMQSGKVIWVKSHRKGDANLGVITKDYVLMKEIK